MCDFVDDQPSPNHESPITNHEWATAMRRFADLYDEIDRTTSTNAKVAALVKYLGEAPPADAAWALFFLTGRRLKRHVPTRLLHAWTLELTGIPEWLVEESYSITGDFAEAIALLLDG